METAATANETRTLESYPMPVIESPNRITQEYDRPSHPYKMADGSMVDTMEPGQVIYRLTTYFPGHSATTWTSNDAYFYTAADAIEAAKKIRGYERSVVRLMWTGRRVYPPHSQWVIENGYAFEDVATWKIRRVKGIRQIVRTK